MKCMILFDAILVGRFCETEKICSEGRHEHV
jgi:hypothetical protein